MLAGMLADNADSLSSILGWVSLACWIVVYSPQIYENYSLQSGEGLSVLFVVIWLLGDLCNLFGAMLAHLLPTVIIIAVYYTLCDMVLLVQIYYYRWRGANCDAEEAPLLPGNRSGNSTSDIVPTRVLVLRYLAALIFVFATGVLAWWISLNAEKVEEPPHHPTAAVRWTVQIFGWASAVLYLGSRIPQIFKNMHTHCEGLSPALFFFAITGNLTYSASIIAKSTDRDYLITNASWLAGTYGSRAWTR